LPRDHRRRDCARRFGKRRRSSLAGKPVRLRFVLKDADLFAAVPIEYNRTQ
jgi:hypothetical protein